MTTILQTIEADAIALWGDVVKIEQTVVSRVENGALTLWNLFKGSVGKLAADEATRVRAYRSRDGHRDRGRGAPQGVPAGPR